VGSGDYRRGREDGMEREGKKGEEDGKRRRPRRDCAF